MGIHDEGIGDMDIMCTWQKCTLPLLLFLESM
jgi:hypothetical protein